MRTMNAVHEATSCSVAACAEIVGAKWTAILVHDLSEGPRRFSELEHSCCGISPRTLSERLRALEAEGIVTSQWSADLPGPAKRTYRLTDDGRRLLEQWVEALRAAQEEISAYLNRYQAHEGR
jgi:DNA-binding HxlR family transcriptional regulator